MKRQRGRNRGGGGGNGGSGGKPQQNANRAFDSNGPDNVKVRGNAQHVFEKYQQLARDAQTAGDRVLAENYLQHAEHYFRLLRAMQPQRPASEILGRDQFASGYDIDFEDEGGGQSQSAEGEGGSHDGESSDGDGESRDRGGWQGRDDRPRDERPRDDRQRDDRPRDERPREDRFRDDRPRDDRQGQGGAGRRDRWRDDRPRTDDRPRGGEDRPRDDRPRDDRPRDERPREERPRDDRPRAEREPRPERDPLAVVEPQSTPLPSGENRGSPVLRDSDGGESHAPAFLQNRAAPTAEAGEPAAPKPRRRRAPRTFDTAADAPSSEPEEA
jgi:hypothetical protein